PNSGHTATAFGFRPNPHYAWTSNIHRCQKKNFPSKYHLIFHYPLFSKGVTSVHLHRTAPLAFSEVHPAQQMVFFIGNYTVTSSTGAGTKIESYLVSDDIGYCREMEKIFKFHPSIAGAIPIFRLVGSPAIT
ncbi:MAG: hypothetical protein SVE93_06585, partial [Candidatus Thermoplasmatota archaeon]|nr:hypothetical protein [Candidatus Thermoplasmatota archaeon]